MKKFALHSIHSLTDLLIKPSFKGNSMHIHAFLMQIMEIISGQHGSQKVPEQSRKPYKTFTTTKSQS